MAILVTRPEPDNRATKAKLRAQGHDVLLAPMLRFEALPFEPGEEEFSAIIATSANALRAVRPLPAPLLQAPLFAVGARTAAVAREDGFGDVRSAQGDSARLTALIEAGGVATAPLLYLAGEDISVDLAAQLEKCGLVVVTRTVYRMVPVGILPDETSRALAGGQVTAVLHYSRRSAQAFVQAVRGAGLEISALAVPQICISAPVAQWLREAGATRPVAAETPDEEALLAALNRILKA